MTAREGTEETGYTDRLRRLEGQRWKRLLDVQAPYRWNVRRLLGGREVLDLGCGIGRNLAHLLPHGVGVDHNPDSVAECRRRGLTAYTPEQFRRSEYAVPGRFGGLLAAHLIEHMPREQAIELLGEYTQYLAAGATVVFVCPQEKGYRTDSTHVAYTDFDGLGELAEALGFTPRRRTSFPLPRAAGKLFAYNEFVLAATR